VNRNGNRTGSKPLESGFPPLLLIVLEGKGGVAKSVTADAAHYCFSSLGYVTLAAESDTTNSIMSSTHDDVVFVSAGKAGWHTTIGVHLQRMGHPGGADVIVFDTGARDEVHVRAKLDYFARTMAAVGGQVLVIRPITTSASAQRNAIDFAATDGSKIATVFMQVRAQGRAEEHFERWSATESLREAKEAGCVDTWIDDLGVEEADEAVALGLSFADVATENFARAGENEAEARAYFDEAKVLWFQDWLEAQRERWLPAFRQALANRPAATPPAPEAAT
jgi:hypothetical protein